MKLIGKHRPNEIDAVAVSGGIDSMVALDFLVRGRYKPDVLFFHHGTETSRLAFEFVQNFCSKNGLTFIWEKISMVKPAKESLEEFWRNQRYAFFNSYNGLIATAHHLNDVAETYVFTGLHGTARLIPYKNKNVIRPFLNVSKKEIERWAESRSLVWMDDKSNFDVHHPRNRIRHNILPEILKVNPGFLKVVRKKLEEENRL